MKTHLKTIREFVELYRCPRTGVAWIEDGRTGRGLSLHPNIDATGSVTGMKRRGYWQPEAQTVKTNGYIYNISRYVPEDDRELNQELLAACRCGGNHG